MAEPEPHLPAGEGDAARRRTDDSHSVAFIDARHHAGLPGELSYGAVVLDRGGGQARWWQKWRVAGIVGAGVCFVGVALALAGSGWRRDALSGQVGAAGRRAGGVSETLSVRSQLIGGAANEPKPEFNEDNSDPEESVEGSQADEALARLLKVFDSSDKHFDVGSFTGWNPRRLPASHHY